VVVAAACFGATFFARDQPCASEGKVEVVVAAAAVVVVVLVVRRQLFSHSHKANRYFRRRAWTRTQRSRAIGNDPSLYAHISLPMLESTPPGAAPGPPVKTGARVRRFRGCENKASILPRGSFCAFERGYCMSTSSARASGALWGRNRRWRSNVADGLPSPSPSVGGIGSNYQ